MLFDQIYEQFKNANSIAIFSHQNSDGDAIGSSIAFKLFFESLGKNVSIFIQKPIHKNYRFLDVKQHVNVQNVKHFDLALALDCPNTSRFGIYQNKFRSIKNSIAFDHHADFANFATLNYGDKTCSSTCLMVYRFFRYINFNITPQVALCLYSGIATDTGRFCYSNLNSEVFDAVSHLYSTNFDFEKANFNLFQCRSRQEVELFTRGINKINYIQNGQIAISKIDQKDLDETNTRPNDTYQIIDYLFNVEGVKIACLLTQYDSSEYLVSIRTRFKYSAQNIAKQFGGGGHIKAAGCRIFESGKLAFEQLKQACLNELQRVDEA